MGGENGWFQNILLCGCAELCISVTAYVHMCEHIHVEVRVQPQVPLLRYSRFVGRHGLLLILSLPGKLHCLAIKPQGPTCLPFPSHRVTSQYPMPSLVEGI